MNPTSFVPGQRWFSTAEPELGLGTVMRLAGRSVQIVFTGTGVVRQYAVDSAPLARAEVQHKVARVAEHMARIQQPFVVLNDTLLRQEPRRTNLQAIYHRASPQPRTVQASEAALRRCSHRLPAGLTDATQALAAAGLEPYSLLLAGALRCDLSAPLTADTLITINREDDDGWFRLSEEFDF